MEMYGRTFVTNLRSTVRCPKENDDELTCILCMPAFHLSCPADTTGCPDAATSSSDVLLPGPMGDPGDAPGTMKSDLGLEQ